MTATTAPPDPATGTEPPSAGQVVRRRWRASRAIVITVVALALLAITIAALRPSVQPGYLDPESAAKPGVRALATILGQRGTPVEKVRDVNAAADRSRPGTVLVIVRTERLTTRDLNRLSTAQGDILLVEPTRFALGALAPGVEKTTSSTTARAEPRCGLPAATMAGRVDFDDSDVYEAPAGSTGCYRAGEFSRLVQLPVAGHTVTVLGSGLPLTNKKLAEEGNAALGMNLAGAGSSVIWLFPEIHSDEESEDAGGGSGGGGSGGGGSGGGGGGGGGGSGGDGGGRQADEQTLLDLVPFGVKLLVLQLVVAVACVALWRARRLGPVVAEALPVVVRSSEAVEGRSRLYRARYARSRAAEELRSGTRERLVPLLGLPRSAAQDPAAAREIVIAVAQRTRWDEATIESALYGPPPADDPQLVGLTDFLDDLERQVRQS